MGFWIFESHRGWPVTEQDLVHILETPVFVDCGANPIPTLDVDTVVRQRGTDFTFEATLSANRGCVADIAVESYEVRWKVTHVQGCIACPEPVSNVETSPLGYEAASVVVNAQEYISQDLIMSLKIMETAIKPRDYRYGARFYVLPLNRTVYHRG